MQTRSGLALPVPLAFFGLLCTAGSGCDVPNNAPTPTIASCAIETATGEATGAADTDAACHPPGAWDQLDASAPRTCTGPWAYQAFAAPCYRYDHGEECGVTRTVTEYEECRHSAHGLHGRPTKTFRGTQKGVKKRVCLGRLSGPTGSVGGRIPGPTDPPGGSCDIEMQFTEARVDVTFLPPTPGASEVTQTFTAKTCQEVAAKARTWLYNKLRPEDPARRYINTMTASGVASGWAGPNKPGPFQIACVLTVRNYPDFNYKKAPPCAVARTYEVPDETAGCRNEAFGDAYDCPTIPYLSSYGVERVDLGHDHGNPALVPLDPEVLTDNDIEPPRCTTCDDVPMNMPAQKYACLHAEYEELTAGPAPSNADRLAAVRRQLSLLLDYQGHDLTHDQRQTIAAIALEQGDPVCDDACAACLEPSIPLPPTSCPLERTAALALRLCSRLALPHTAIELRHVLLESCLDPAVVPPSGDPACQGDLLANAFLAIQERVLDDTLSAPLAGPLDPNDLRRRIIAVDRWYRVAQAMLFAPGDEDGLARATSGVMGRLWNGLPIVDASGTPIDDLLTADTAPTGNALEALVLELGASGLEQDRRVLETLYPSAGTPPMTTRPLLAITADSLAGLVQRLDQLTDAHDMACRFADCQTGSLQTPVSDARALLGSLFDADALADALAEPPRLSAAWRNVFARLHAHHDILAQAISDALGETDYDPALLYETPLPDLPAELTQLVAIVLEARGQSDRYHATGRFAAAAGLELPTSAQSSRRDTVLGLYTTRLGALHQDLALYRDELRTRVRELLEDSRQRRVGQGIADTLARKGEQFEQLSADIAGLRLEDALEAERFGGFTSSFLEVVENDPNFDDELLIALDPPRTVPAAPTSTFDFVSMDRSTTAVADVAITVPGYPDGIAVTAGDVLFFDVANDWSPTCAVRDVIPSLDGAPRLTGPEGYLIQESASGFDVSSHTTSADSRSYVSESQTSTECSGLTIGGPASFSGVPLFGGSYRDETCDRFETGTTRSRSSTSSSTSGEESRWSIATAIGIRSPTAPVPTAPAGSLLVVETMPSTGEVFLGDFVDARVLMRRTTYVATHDAVLHIVPNERTGCATDGGHGQLTVTVSHQRPTGSLIRAVRSAMASAVAALRERGQQMVDHAAALPDAISTARLETYAAVRRDCDCDPATFPSTVMSFFDTWVQAEIAHIERLVQIEQLTRQRRLITLDTLSLRQELEANDTELRLIALAPRWIARGVTLLDLRAAIEDLIDVAEHHMYPVLRLRYPSALTSLAVPGSAVRALLDTDPTLGALEPGGAGTAPTTILGRIKTALSAIKTEYENALIAVPDVVRRRVAVYFPNPYAPLTPAPYRTVDPARAKRLWDAIANNDRAPIEIIPEDLYQLTGPSILACNDEAPVVEHMGVAIVTPGSDPGTNGAKFSTTHRAHGDQTFVTSSGRETYRLTGEAWLSGLTPLLFGPVGQIGPMWDELAKTTDASGLSPFAAFDLRMPFNCTVTGPGDVDCLKSRLQSARGLVVFFDIEAQPGDTVDADTCTAD